MVRHRNAQPLQIELVSQGLECLVQRILPGVGVSDAKIDRSVALLVSCQFLLFALLFPFVSIQDLLESRNVLGVEARILEGFEVFRVQVFD